MSASKDTTHAPEPKDNIQMETLLEPSTMEASSNEAPDKSSAVNPFDPAALRIDPTQDIELGAKQLVSNSEARRPLGQEFIRVSSDKKFRMPIAIIEIKGSREIYIVTPTVANLIPEEVKRVELRTCINRAGVVFLWPVPLPSAEGRETAWHTSARFAAETAETRWVRMRSNMGAGRYDVIAAPLGIADPIWPEIEFSELLRLAFGDGKLINSIDHPVIKSLKGQI